MAFKKYNILDLGRANLDGNVAISDTTITLKNLENLPTSNFTLTLRRYDAEGEILQNERIYVTTRTGNVLSGVTRGYANSSAKSWLDGDDVQANVIAEHIIDIQNEIDVINGLFASKANIDGGNELNGTQIVNGEVVVNSTANSVFRLRDDGVETFALYSLANQTDVYLRSVGDTHFKTGSSQITRLSIFEEGHVNIGAVGTAALPALSIGVTTQGLFDSGINRLGVSVGAGTHSLDISPGSINILGSSQSRIYHSSTSIPGILWEQKVSSNDDYSILRAANTLFKIDNDGRVDFFKQSGGIAGVFQSAGEYTALKVLNTNGGLSNWEWRANDNMNGLSPYNTFSLNQGDSYNPAMVVDSNQVTTLSNKLGVGMINTGQVAARFHIYDNTTTTTSGIGGLIEQDGSGDAKMDFLLTGVRRWIMGIDNSDSDKFKISTGGSNLGTGDVVEIEVDGTFHCGAGASNGFRFTSPASTAGASSELPGLPSGTCMMGVAGSNVYLYWIASGIKYYATISGTTF